MNITSAQYLSGLISGSNVLIKATIDGEEMFVPIDSDNKEYAAIKAKHDDSNDSFTIQDAD